MCQRKIRSFGGWLDKLRTFPCGSVLQDSIPPGDDLAFDCGVKHSQSGRNFAVYNRGLKKHLLRQSRLLEPPENEPAKSNDASHD